MRSVANVLHSYLEGTDNHQEGVIIKMLTLSLALLATVHKSNPGVTFLSKVFLPLSRSPFPLCFRVSPSVHCCPALEFLRQSVDSMKNFISRRVIEHVVFRRSVAVNIFILFYDRSPLPPSLPPSIDCWDKELQIFSSFPTSR